MLNHLQLNLLIQLSSTGSTERNLPAWNYSSLLQQHCSSATPLYQTGPLRTLLRMLKLKPLMNIEALLGAIDTGRNIQPKLQIILIR